MAKKRVFVSFDFDNDQDLKILIIGQARNPDSPFDVVDTSLKEEAPQQSWEEKARRAIKGSDRVLVMVGENTYRAPGVLKEVKIAREESVLVYQVKGHKDKYCPSVSNTGQLWDWDWDVLKILLG